MIVVIEHFRAIGDSSSIEDEVLIGVYFTYQEAQDAGVRWLDSQVAHKGFRIDKTFVKA